MSMARELGFASPEDWLRRVSGRQAVRWMALAEIEAEERKERDLARDAERGVEERLRRR